MVRIFLHFRMFCYNPFAIRTQHAACPRRTFRTRAFSFSCKYSVYSELLRIGNKNKFVVTVLIFICSAPALHD